MPSIDPIGQKFNRWTVLRYVPAPSHIKRKRDVYVEAQCECASPAKIILLSNIVKGKTKSCGCLRSIVSSKPENIALLKSFHGKNATHGMSEELIYGVWLAMKRRCYNQNTKDYLDYGGRGIKVCDRWLGDSGFENFYADMGSPPPGMTLDRFPDKDGNYEPGNCRWATTKQQARNTRRNVWWEYDGDRKTVTEWAEALGVKSESLRNRVANCGWSIEKALTYNLDAIKKRKDAIDS